MYHPNTLSKMAQLKRQDARRNAAQRSIAKAQPTRNTQPRHKAADEPLTPNPLTRLKRVLSR